MSSNYNNFGIKSERSVYKNLFLVSVIFAFSVGLTIGILIRVLPKVFETSRTNQTMTVVVNDTTTTAIRTVFLNNSYGNSYRTNNNKYPTVTFVENPTSTTIEETSNFLENGIYWGRRIEQALPIGYREKNHQLWTNYIKKAIAVKLEIGCGRMQNRLVVFQDGLKGCVRYRQNTDQIQGELFSFYLAQILELPNLAPSAVSVVDLSDPLWENLRNDIASAQWNSNKPIVLTQYIGNLGTANIPTVFKPLERHLNKLDVINMTTNNNNEILGEDLLIKNFVELAQWSDLIIFDYLTANLDRIVNNLYNYQWNVNIMDAPAHNLAKKTDNDLLIFLDNESGLLHGYRLLKKYEIYHSILLENLCLFRKQTADIIKQLKLKGNIGRILKDKFELENSAAIKDILPALPDKSVKILNERIDKVYNQIIKCESIFSDIVT